MYRVYTCQIDHCEQFDFSQQLWTRQPGVPQIDLLAKIVQCDIFKVVFIPMLWVKAMH